MNRKTLYNLAIEMLENTNPFQKDVTEICNLSSGLRLHQLVKEQLGSNSARANREGMLQKNYEICYVAIEAALEEYSRKIYSTNYSYKQELRRRYIAWAKEIAETYNIPKEKRDIKFLEEKIEKDTVIALVKSLHDRKGKSVEEISEETNLNSRVVQKWLKKLNESTDNNQNLRETESGCCIAGQPVCVKIQRIPKEEDKRTIRYRTLNTMHPLVLQENLMQVGVLLQSLAHNYVERESNISIAIGIDIWAQLSEYAREKVKEHFSVTDACLAEFISALENSMTLSKDPIGFYTERELAKREGLSYWESMVYASKGAGRICDLKLYFLENVLYDQNIQYFETQNGSLVYRAVSREGTSIDFQFEDVEWIETKS